MIGNRYRQELGLVDIFFQTEVVRNLRVRVARGETCVPAVPNEGQKAKPTFTAILVGVPVATDTRFSAGIIVQSEHVTCG